MMAVPDRGVMCVLWQAHAVAISAVAGVNAVGGAEDLADMAGRLPEGHAMRAAVARFRAVQASRFPSADDLAEAGRALRHAVGLCLMPVPVGQERADIHG